MKKIISGIVAFALLGAVLVPASAANVLVRSATERVLMPGGVFDMTQGILEQSKAKISKEEAKGIASKVLKDCFDINVDNKEYEVMIDYRPNMMAYPGGNDFEDQEYMWNINYQMNTSNMGYTQATIVVNATSGVVTNISRYENSYNQGTQAPVAVYKQDQAKKIAEEFLGKINPEKLKETKEIENFMQDYFYAGPKMPIYNFMYARQVNGLPFDNDAITISVDGVSGKVTSYDLRWSNNKTFPSIQGVISKEAALEKLKTQLNLSLNYIPLRNNNNYSIPPKEAKLVYIPGMGENLAIDAKTGKSIDLNQIIGTTPRKKDLNDKEKTDFITKYKALIKKDKEMDNSMAGDIMITKLKEILNEDYDVNYISYQDSGKGFGANNSKAWSGQFYKKGSNPSNSQPGGSITVDALTGKIIFLNTNDMMEVQANLAFAPKITWDEAYYKALDLVAANFPEKVKEIKTEQEYVKQEMFLKEWVPSTSTTDTSTSAERFYSFNFARVINGIPSQEDQISVGFDAKTGLPNQLSSMWNNDITFPDSKNVLNIEEAKKIYLDNENPQMAYMSLAGTNNKNSKETSLVYRVGVTNLKRGAVYIDALSGNWLNYTGENIDSEKDQENFVNLIKGHWAEKQLEILGFQGIIDTNSFIPEKEITKIEALKMLVNAKGNSYYMGKSGDILKFTNVSEDAEEYKYLQMAVSYGIINNKNEEFQLESKVKREEMAEMIVKLVKYDKIANAKDIFTLPFSDAKEIKTELFGYVAIGKGLGIFMGDNGKFRPKDNVLMAEMAAAIYSGLETIQSESK